MIGLVNEDVVRQALREECENGLRKFCRKNKLDPGNISNILNNDKPIMDSVLKALGFVKVTMYQRL